MSYTVGFDLGTHQTKICIQDNTNAAEKIYEFLEFKKPDGTSSVLFPSIVQINTDDTVSYGFVDDQQCLELSGTPIEKPSIYLEERPSLPQSPHKKQAKYPKKPIYDPWKDSLMKLKGLKTSIDKWEDECANIDATINTDWKRQCSIITAEYDRICESINSDNNNKKMEYEREFAQWKESQEKERCNFRYFKLRALTDSGVWKHSSFTAQEISVWYIAYLLITLSEKLDDDFYIQFGTPVSGNHMNRDKAITECAYSVYIAAYKLSKKYSSSSEYLKASYKELRRHTDLCRVNEEIINEYFFDDIPEAFAGLIAVTTQKRLGTGFHLLADIGGGTTDIAMFFVDHKTLLPDVISISSFAKGLNYVFEQTQFEENKSLNDLQELFLINSNNSMFESAVKEYIRILIDNGELFENCLFDAFCSSMYYHGRSPSELSKVLDNQPIIYCGGGAVYTQFHISIGHFTDVRKIDKELLNIKHVRNNNQITDKLYPILAISYGLASYTKPFDGSVKCTDISVIFKKYLPQKNIVHPHEEYGLLDD